MVDVDRLRGLMAQHKMTQAEVAESLGIGVNTLYRKMKRRQFDTDECEKLITLFDIKDPTIFFSNIVNSQVTTQEHENGKT